MESKAKACSKVHAVCIPSPFQSHIKAMLQPAKLLHHKGFHITFVNTEFNHRCFLISRGHHSLDGLPNFRFEAIPDGLSASSYESSTTQDMYSLCENIINNVLLQPFLDLLAKLSDSSNNVNPAVSCIISDGFMAFTITAAQRLGLPIALFFTISACSFKGLKQFQTLKEKGLFPLKDESCLKKEYLDSVIDWIPGMAALFETAFVYDLKVYRSYAETFVDCGGAEALPIEARSLSGFDLGQENKMRETCNHMY